MRQSSSSTSSKESRCTKGKPTTAETMYPGVKSTMICDGPQSRLTKSTDAAIATGSLHRFIGSSRKTPLIAVSGKFSFGSWNQWAISKEILLRILRKYFLPFKKRAHEGCPHLKGAHLILNEIRSRTVEKRSSWGAGLRRPAYRLRSRPWTTPWDINSMTTRSSAQRR